MSRSDTDLSMVRADDWHVHLRDGAWLALTVPHVARQFARALVMPNLNPPVTTCDQALAYRDRILAAVPAGCDFSPQMTLYLNTDTTHDEIVRACASGCIVAGKYYPAGATTNSRWGVGQIERLYPVFESMQQLGMVLCLHGEVVDSDVDVFARERVFIERHLAALVENFPQLKIVLEHISTHEAVEFVRDAPDTLAASVTPQHLLYNRNALFEGGLRPHHYCLPVLKHERHRRALADAALSGNPKFFLGTDSAPHDRSLKESACGCAGVYSAHAALALYAEFFACHEALDKYEAFASHYGADFYGVARNESRVKLHKTDWTVPDSYGSGSHRVVPLRAGELLRWSLPD